MVALMTKIPKQLQNEKFRFVKIRNKQKAPFEKDWQNSSNYKWDNQTLQEHIELGGNYGVACGFGHLVVIDCDQKKVQGAAEKNLPKTFTVKTPGGGTHHYYISKDIDRPIRMMEDRAGDLGDVQFTGKQVVGPGSIHPNGKQYEICNDTIITEVKIEQIRFALKDFIKTNVERTLEEEQMLTESMDINLSISQVVSAAGLKSRGSEYQGPHPIHGSKTGVNFSMNTIKNVWHCFRCDSGGGPLSWIAVEEGLINCSDAQPGVLRGDLFRKTLKVAKEKYGLRIKEETRGYKKDGKFVPKLLADDILRDYNFKTLKDTSEILFYNSGIYHSNGEALIKEEAQKRFGEELTTHWANEIIFHIQASTYTEREDFDKNKHLIHLENGIFNIETMKLENLDPNIMSTVGLIIKHDPDADCPKIKQFLSEVVSEDDITVVQEMIGYCLLRDYPIHKAFMLIGDGANGKSTLLELIKTFLGGNNISNVSLQNFEKNRFSSAQLYGKLANIYADLTDISLYKTGVFKMLTGGDTVSAEKKFKGMFGFVNTAKLLFSANKLPETTDDSSAFFRRWIFLNFPNKFEGGNADKHLLKKITSDEELSGLFNWVIDGLKRLLKNADFSDSMTTDQIQDLYERMSSPIIAFIKDMTEQDSEGIILKEDLYRVFVAYCKKNKLPTMANNTFARKLIEHFPNIFPSQKTIEGKKGRTVWLGIKFKKGGQGIQGIQGISPYLKSTELSDIKV